MKNKDLIMLGIIIGIAFFFIGAMVSNVFPTSESDLTSYKFSAFMKLFGIGILTASMVVGGIIIEGIDKNLKFLMLILGLVLLIIYSIGSPWLNWDISLSDIRYSGGETAYSERPTALGTPGFELIYAILAIGVFLIIRKIKIRR